MSLVIVFSGNVMAEKIEPLSNADVVVIEMYYDYSVGCKIEVKAYNNLDHNDCVKLMPIFDKLMVIINQPLYDQRIKITANSQQLVRWINKGSINFEYIFTFLDM